MKKMSQHREYLYIEIRKKGTNGNSGVEKFNS